MSGHGEPQGLGVRSDVSRRIPSVGAGHAREAFVTVGRAQIRCLGAHGLGGPATPYGLGAFSGVGCAVRTDRVARA